MAPWSGPILLGDLMARRSMGALELGAGVRDITFLSGAELLVLAVTFNDRVELYDPASRVRHGPPIPVAPWTRRLAMDTIDGTDVLAVWEPEAVRFLDAATGPPFAPSIELSGAQNGIAFGRVDGREVLLTAHHATVRVWNPRTGRRLSELPFGTSIDAMAVEEGADGRLLVAVSGPGVVVAELVDPRAA